METVEHSSSTQTKPQKQVQASLAFSKPTDVSADTTRPGLLRAATQPFTADVEKAFQFYPCKIADAKFCDRERFDLVNNGFEIASFNHNPQLLKTLNRLKTCSYLSQADATELRRLIRGVTIPLSQGKRLKMLYVAGEGMILRKAGPNGLKVNPDEPLSGSTGHDGATTIHGDQDILGTPLNQILKGTAKHLFNHQAPDSENKNSRLHLVNIWIPLQQLTRPLTLMDRQSLNMREHQLRYALPIDAFLERDKSQKFNDIWTFLHHDEQEWHFNSGLKLGDAYVFDTLGTPHGAFYLPGEEILASYFEQLREIRKALVHGRNQFPRRVIQWENSEGLKTTDGVLAAIEKMENVLRQSEKKKVGRSVIRAWCQEAATVMDSVVRKSVELRAVGWMNRP